MKTKSDCWLPTLLDVDAADVGILIVVESDDDGSEDVDGLYEVESYNNGSTVGSFVDGGLIVSEYNNGSLYEMDNNKLDNERLTDVI